MTGVSPIVATVIEFPIETEFVSETGTSVEPALTGLESVSSTRVELYSGTDIVVNPTTGLYETSPSNTPSVTVLKELPIETPAVFPTPAIVAPILATAVTVVFNTIVFTKGRSVTPNPVIGTFVATPAMLKEFPIDTPLVLATAMSVDPIFTSSDNVVVACGVLNGKETVLDPKLTILAALINVPILTKSPTCAEVIFATAKQYFQYQKVPLRMYQE